MDSTVDDSTKEHKVKSPTALREEEVLSFWEKDGTFGKSLAKEAPKGEFVFYDGPPFATGLPHHGSLLSSIIKDVIPRYKTMRGFRVRRRWGWDTHGLPIENLVEKELGLKTKKDILDIGIAKFNETARSLVLKYVSDWERYITRVGRWVDYENSYKTMDNSFIESVWWGLKELSKKGLLYEGRKVLMYCPHCETPLAKAEIAADNTYQDITEEAVTVKFRVKNPEKHGLPENTFILAWTTTPWTLPGNVALAVGSDIEYVKAKKLGEAVIQPIGTGTYPVNVSDESVCIVAKSAWGNYHLSPSEGEPLKGKDLVGIEYEPLFDVPALKSDKSYKVYSADFVNTEDGTGIVHTAVMYGEDDFVLGQKEGLPMIQLLNANGTYNDNAPEFLRGKYIKTAEKDIKAYLKEQKLLFGDPKNNTHSYPHCWRCSTPLIYNAVPSWFINIQKVKDKLLSENKDINWVPEHLKEGRFKHIVENAPDWTISRNRFWASPLPIWKEKGGSKMMVIGSLEELSHKAKKSGNRYFVMRHGQAESNVNRYVDSNPNSSNSLTIEGIEETKKAAENLGRTPDLIFTSPLPRARETAQLIKETLNLSDAAIFIEPRLSEISFGKLEGRPAREYDEHFGHISHYFSKKIDGAETWTDVKKRVWEFLSTLEETYQDKTILIVTHDTPALLINTVSRGEDDVYAAGQKNHNVGQTYLKNAEVREVPFKILPRNTSGEVDIHRPYTDTIILLDGEGKEYERIPEVIDCWVESGSMPFAELHYPFENEDVFKKRFPGDFIAEYIAQTRTWFYYMHVLGVSLFDRLAFRNVVTTGTILAANGDKISKSKRNYTDPLILIDQYGSDALRFYLMSSPIMQAEDLRFRDEDVRDVHNRVIQMLSNCLAFFELYKDEFKGDADPYKSKHLLDQWILARLDELIESVTAAFESYDLPKATRPIRDFADDYSTWYVRRSRERVKGDDEEDKQYALGTQKKVLEELSKLIAPVMPFLAEHISQKLGNKESVHLGVWPPPHTRGIFSLFRKSKHTKALLDMREIRDVVSRGLEARQRAGLKVRQPLQSLSISNQILTQNTELSTIIAEEVNVKEILYNKEAEGVLLNTNLTEELRKEGLMRELIRAIQDKRKEMKLEPKDRVEVVIKITSSLSDSFAKDIARAVQADRVSILSGSAVEDILVSKI